MGNELVVVLEEEEGASRLSAIYKTTVISCQALIGGSQRPEHWKQRLFAFSLCIIMHYFFTYFGSNFVFPDEFDKFLFHLRKSRRFQKDLGDF